MRRSATLPKGDYHLAYQRATIVRPGPAMTRGCCSAGRAGCITRVRSVSYAVLNKYLVDAQNAQIRNGALPIRPWRPCDHIA